MRALGQALNWAAASAKAFSTSLDVSIFFLSSLIFVVPDFINIWEADAVFLGPNKPSNRPILITLLLLIDDSDLWFDDNPDTVKLNTNNINTRKYNDCIANDIYIYMY